MWQETEITRIALGTDRLPGCMDSYLHQIREGGHELLQAVGGTALESFSLGVLGNIAEKLGIAAHMEPELPTARAGQLGFESPGFAPALAEKLSSPCPDKAARHLSCTLLQLLIILTIPRNQHASTGGGDM